MGTQGVRKSTTGASGSFVYDFLTNSTTSQVAMAISPTDGTVYGVGVSVTGLR